MSIDRRGCLKIIGQGFASGLVAGGSTGLALAAQSASRVEASKMAMPGLYPGRVSAVRNPAAIVGGHYQAEAVREMMQKGMMDLTGADGWVDAWRHFCEPGDVVGIKLNPVGQPLVKSDVTVGRGIIAGLEAAGVRRRDIIAYDRYRKQFLQAGYDKWLPDGVRISNAVEDYDSIQQGIE